MADLKRRIIAEFSAKNRAKGVMSGFRKDMDDTGRTMLNMAKGALAMAGIGGGLYAAKRGFDYVTKAAMKQEDALFLLQAALKTAGEYSEGTMSKFEAFAASIQQATVYGDEEVLALMQLMKSLGVTSNKLEQATRMAIGLAAATGRDVKSMSMYIALAQQGEFTMLRRYIPALRSTTDATEQLRIVTEFAAAGFEIAKAQAETASGAFGQMWNTVSDLAEVMGKPFIDTMAKDAKKATTNIQILTAAIKKHREAMEESIKSEGRMKYMPIGAPFAVPIVSKDVSDWYRKPTGREELAGQLADEAWAMKELAKAYEEGNKQAALEAKQIEAMDKRRMETEEDWGKIYLKQEDERVKKIQESDKAIIDAARERVNAIRNMDFATRTERIQNLEAYVAANEDALVRVAEANKILKDEITALEREKWAGLKRWGREARDIYLQLDQIAVSSFDRMADALTDLCLRGKADFGALAQSVLSDLTRMIIKMQMAQLLGFGGGGVPMWFSAGVGGALGGLGGGPPAGTRIQNLPGTISATYLQGGGEVVKTGWAKVHRGETYSGVGRGEVGGVTVNVNNDGMEKFEVSQAAEYWAGDQRVVDIFITKARTDGGLRRAIKEAAK